MITVYPFLFHIGIQICLITKFVSKSGFQYLHTMSYCPTISNGGMRKEKKMYFRRRLHGGTVNRAFNIEIKNEQKERKKR